MRVIVIKFVFLKIIARPLQACLHAPFMPSRVACLPLLPGRVTCQRAHSYDELANGEEELAGLAEEELAKRMAEARAVFEQFDADGSGSIDANELKDALDASDMDVSAEVYTCVCTHTHT
jgi:hypothetical protein